MTQLSRSNDAIGEALGLTPLDEVLPAIVEPSQTSTDFEYARGNLIAAIEKGQEALSGVLEVAGMSQHPRAYEVAAKLIDSVSSANKDLLELSQRKQQLEGNVGGGPKTVNNNLFVGSTAELQKFLKQQHNE